MTALASETEVQATRQRRRRTAKFVATAIGCSAIIFASVWRDGVTVSGGVAAAILSLLFAALAIAGERRRSRISPQKARREARVGWAILLGFLAIEVMRFVASPSAHSPRPLLAVNDNVIVSPPLRLRLPIADGWELLPAPAGQVTLRSTVTGAVLVGGVIGPRPRDESLESSMYGVLASIRGGSKTVRDLEVRAQRRLGARAARSITMTLERADGTARTELIIAEIRPYTVQFNCFGSEAEFGAARQDCDALLARLELPL
jgi:hypothetical protein